MTLALVTFDWLPEFPRGFVRDMRVRWALEELGRPYHVETVPSHPKSGAHLKIQPFGQVPAIRDADLTLFETGAILMHLSEGTELLPPTRRPQVTQWLFTALNTIEPACGHWLSMVLAARVPDVFGPAPDPAVTHHAQRSLNTRLAALEQVTASGDWLVEGFTVADIAMIDVLRVIASEGGLKDCPALEAYMRRGTARPAFAKAMADHMAHWQAADAARAAVSPA
jgi:glutathione S-transferase